MKMQDASIYNELKRIEKENGMVTPHLVVEEARDESSPLHNKFDWNDESAAHNYRLWQARALIKSVKITYEDTVMPAFLNVKVAYEGDGEEQGYVSTPTVVSVDAFRIQAEQEAIKWLRHWQSRYGHLKNLSGVVDTNRLESIAKDLDLE